MNAYGVGGTIRATFTSAAALARKHDVEIVSVLRDAKKPDLPLDPAVRLRTLTDLREEAQDEVEEIPGAPARMSAAWRRWALGRPSRLMHPGDSRYEDFNLLSDANLLRFLRETRDGVLIGTRPAINVAMARFARPSVVRVGQDHMNLGRYKPELIEGMAEAYPRLDALIALTQRTAQDYRDMLGASTRVEAIPNGVRNASGLRAALEAPVVVSAGRMTPQKGFDRLIQAWTRAEPDHPGWELKIFGDGRLENRLRRQIRDLGLKRAWLMGRTSELSSELAASSLYVMTSRFEGFPMVLLEAMSVGLPVVSYDIETGPSEVVDHGVNGFVVPDGDEAALAEAMGELMSDPEKRRRFGAAALETVARYDPDVVLGRFESLLEEFAARKEAAPPEPRVPPALASVAKRPLEAARGFRGRDSLNAALTRVTGYQLVKPESLEEAARRANKRARRRRPPIPDHYDDEARKVIRAVRDWTMTSHEKLFALIEATRYVVDQQVPGAVVECGVWRGGSMQAVARTLLARGAADRDLHLLDTFEGMPPPDEVDRRHDGAAASELLATRPKESKVWAIASLEDVQAGMAQTGYPQERIHFHPGPVEKTVPAEVPEQIALLRLDTDWYESTRHELEHLYERVPPGGVILLDDYGYWEGARRAVDEFVDERDLRLLLVPMGTGRIAVKP